MLTPGSTSFGDSRTINEHVGGGRAAIVNASFKRNMCLDNLLLRSVRLGALQLRMGEGRESTHNNLRPDFVCLPPDLCLPSDQPSQLVHVVYSDLGTRVVIPELFTHNCILTPENDDVHMLDTSAMATFPGAERVYFSAD